MHAGTAVFLPTSKWRSNSQFLRRGRRGNKSLQSKNFQVLFISQLIIELGCIEVQMETNGNGIFLFGFVALRLESETLFLIYHFR